MPTGSKTSSLRKKVQSNRNSREDFGESFEIRPKHSDDKSQFYLTSEIITGAGID